MDFHEIFRIRCAFTCFVLLFNEIRDSEQHYEETYQRIFMKFLGKFGHETRNNLKYFRDVTANQLNLGSFFSIFWI